MELSVGFNQIRNNIVGQNLKIDDQPVIYADWTASGRLYAPIEHYMTNVIGPWVANTHTESSDTGRAMTALYNDARLVIKSHVNASSDDVLICTGTGMTGAVNKLQRIMGLKTTPSDPESPRPLVIITHMEHHSNQTSWHACHVDLEIVRRAPSGFPDLDHLEDILMANANRPLVVGSFSACSNVTGIKTPYHDMASLMHKYGGLCFVDFAASAPYVDIDMHPEDESARLDAVLFSPHKFLGGPGSCGVLIFNADLYHLDVPDQPGGGTVTWTNPWGGHKYFDDIEIREDGGTPGFLQTIRAAFSIKLKDSMTTQAIHAQERVLTQAMFAKLNSIENLNLLEPEVSERLPIFSFWIDNMHHNLVVRLLNDKYGIQSRGGCSCAGTYGHILLGVDQQTSETITCEIDHGDLTHKPGWIRISLHPTMTLQEVSEISEAVAQVAKQGAQWQDEYHFDAASGEWNHRSKVRASGPKFSDLVL